jgi:hypothetical protein
MSEIAEAVATTPIPTLLIGLLLLALTVLFAIIFVGRGATLTARLGKAAAALKVKNPNIQMVRQILSSDGTLAHLWTEYLRTLHRPHEAGPGQDTRESYRSTVPAASIFTTEVIVDSRLWTEFFKHLPGIFTGLGIIGTFSGLIRGLQAFQVSPDAAVVRGGLEGLMHRVGDAFFVSALAITLAMAATLIERWIATHIYKQVEELTSALDGLFTPVSDEDYLARLTRASEDSAAQAKILKDALVGDLERILTTLAERQIAAQQMGIQKLGEVIGGTLAGPLDAISAGARRNSEGNNEAVTRLLTDVLAGFSQRMEDLFGGQISGINTLQQQTIDALGAAVAKLNQMVSAVEEAGTKSADALNERLLSALKDMETHQKAANERMAAFVDQMRGTVDQSQNETNQKLQETLSQIGTAVKVQLAALREQGEQSTAAQLQRDGVVSARTDELLRTLGGRVDEVLGALRDQMDRAAQAQADRDRYAAAVSEENDARLSAAVDAQIAALREQGERSASAQSERESATAARMDETLRALGARVDEVVGAMNTQANKSAEAQDVRERRAAAVSDENMARLTAAVEAQMAKLREQADLSARAQSEREASATAQTGETLGLLGSKVEEVMGTLRTHLERAAESQGRREQQLSESMASAIENLSRVAETMMAEARAIAVGVGAAVGAMRDATTAAIDKMNSGSETLYLAASEFKTAGQAVSTVFQQAEGLSHGLRQSAGSVADASAALQGVVADHAGAREGLSKMIEEMRRIVEIAKREAGVTTEVISRIEAASRGLGQAQKKAEDYLNEVTRILAATHETYATSLASALGDQYRAFFARLSEATGLLQAAIMELAVTVQPSIKRAAE